VNTAKARAVLAEAQNKAAQASKVATRESLPSPEPRATSENDLAGNNIASTAHTATVDDEETKAAAAAAVRLQASVTAAEAAVGRAESERRAAAVAFETASAAVAAAVIVVPLRATKQEHPRSNRQGEGPTIIIPAVSDSVFFFYRFFWSPTISLVFFHF